VACGKAAVIASGGSRRSARCAANCPVDSLRQERAEPPFQPVHDGDQHVLNPAIAQFVHHRKPEFCSFIIGDPQARNLAQTVPGDAKGHIYSFVFNHPAVGIAGFDPQGIEYDNRIHPLQRPALPFADLAQHRIGDPADQVGRHFQPVKVFQMGLNISKRRLDGTSLSA